MLAVVFVVAGATVFTGFVFIVFVFIVFVFTVFILFVSVDGVIVGICTGLADVPVAYTFETNNTVINAKVTINIIFFTFDFLSFFSPFSYEFLLVFIFLLENIRKI